MDVVDLQNFYASPLGKATHRVIDAKLNSHLAGLNGGRCIGVGFATPYLLPDENTFALMPARSGVVHWPATGLVHSALIDEYDLPLPDNSVELALVIHALEFIDEPSEMLQELWRVLTPQGQLIVVVPNRVGLWSLSDASPFGQGQPFSRMQLQRHLKEAQFSINKLEGTLFMPPWGKGAALNLSKGLEKFGAAALGHFSGALIAQATKQVYAYASGRKKLAYSVRPRTVLLGRPQPSHCTENKS